MAAVYTARVSNELIADWDTDLLPEGLRIVRIGEPDPAVPWRIVTFHDDGAPEELNGQVVTPYFRVRTDGMVILAGRDFQ